MKRGLVGLIPLVFFLTLPKVFAADSFLGLITGTSDSSLIFLKVAYAMLIFIIFLKVCKETIFKKEQQKLGNIFSLLLAFFAFRFTPDPVVQSFGWVIMFIAPFIIFYTLYGVFVKKTEGKISWLRLILALVSTLILFFALGSTPAFAAGLGSTPGAGGFLSEMFSDLHYLIFYKLNTFFVFLLAAIVIGLLFMLISRLPGVRGGAGGGFGDSFLRAFLWMLGIIAVLALLGYLLGGGLAGLALPGGALGFILANGFWLLVVLALLFLLWLLFRYPAFRQVVWNVLRFLFWRVPRAIALALWWLLQRLWRGIVWFFTRLWGLIVAIGSWIANRWRTWRGTPRAPLANRQLILDLRAGPQNIGNIAQLGGPRITVLPGTATPFAFTAYRSRRAFGRNFGRVRLAGLNITVIRANNGAIAPATVTTNARGECTVTYTAPAVAGVAVMEIQFAPHPDIDPTQTIPNRDIQIGVTQNLTITVPAVAPIFRGNTADITVEARDPAGNGVNGLNVEIRFPRIALSAPLTGTTTAGGPAAPGLIVLTTAVFPISTGSPFAFTVNILNAPALGFNVPAAVPGAIAVNDPATPTLLIDTVEARVGRTIVNAAPLIPIRVGQTANISLVVRTLPVPPLGTRPAVASRLIDTATVILTPSVGAPIAFTALGTAGRYTANLAPTTALVGPQTFVLTAIFAGHNAAAPVNLDLEIEDVPQLTLGVVPLPSPMRSDTTQNIRVQVQSGGVNVNATIIIQQNGTEILRSVTGTPGVGQLIIPYTAPRVTTPTNVVIQISAQNRPAYLDAPNQTFTVVVLPLGDMDIDVEFLDTTGTMITGPFAVGQVVDITVFARERGTGTMITTGTAALTPLRLPNSTLLTPSGPLTASGHTARFSATAPGAYTYTLTVVVPGFTSPRPAPSFTLNVVVPTMNVVLTPIATPVFIGVPVNLNFTITDATSGAPLPGRISITPGTRFVPVPGPFTAGTFSTDFTPSAAGPITLTAVIRSPGYADFTLPIPMTVTMPTMVVTIAPVTSPLRVGTSTDIDITVRNAAGAPIPGAAVVFTNRAGGRMPAGFFPPAWIAGPPSLFRAAFAPTAAVPAGIYIFDIAVTATGYAPWNGNVQVEVLSNAGLRATVNWVPEPTTANRYMLMNFVVINDVTGAPVRNATINITDRHGTPVTFDRPGPYVTNASGQLATELRISLGGRMLSAGGKEEHPLHIEITSGRLRIENVDATGVGIPIILTFNPQRSRLGGPETRSFP